MLTLSSAAYGTPKSGTADFIIALMMGRCSALKMGALKRQVRPGHANGDMSRYAL